MEDRHKDRLLPSTGAAREQSEPTPKKPTYTTILDTGLLHGPAEPTPRTRNVYKTPGVRPETVKRPLDALPIILDSSAGAYAFRSCSNLISIMMPNSITNIGMYTFWSCNNLMGVYFSGDAFNEDFSTFFDANNSTIYYLPETKGWSNTFCGRPTMLWKPRVQNNSSLGVQTNAFGFTSAWASDQTIVVEACTNLTNPNWLLIETITFTNGSSYFSDPQWANHSGRFYRLRSP